MENMPSTELLHRAYQELEAGLREIRARKAARRRASPVDLGSKVIVGLRGGGRVEGILARGVERAVVIEREEVADVIVLESASSITRVLPKD